ncbi:lactate racemase domain-containing protein [Bacillus sp. REN16]|uniref:lactate racemase domain-containing protein n=1 Tax=Bacillus sp. REN16 TaxID=2887296 RepID=UPI001E561D2F|nr:lactate racemase domain-containing protein [Bacillus sp. REN16]MCC3358987.1 nickel-dependent lactate racemase [Bacillus sp. REN16]
MNFGKVNVTIEGGFDNIELPKMIKVHQKFNDEKIADVETHISNELAEKMVLANLQGKRIAITAGSRGIKDIDKITKKVLDELKDAGAEPFIVPAMGSHGGATAEGQKHFLENYNITEESMNVPIISSMDTVKVGMLDEGIPVYCDKNAYNSDGIVLINKVKPHADFKGDYESGLVKMMVIGLGKHAGATSLHKQGFDTFHYLLPRAAEQFLKGAPVIFGLAIVENAYDDIMRIEAIHPEHILDREKDLLKLAKENIARINVNDIDVLIVDEIGKNISGEGMDPNVTGRPGSMLKEGFDAPDIKKIVVLDVTKQSHGNGAGIGMSDISTTKCVSKIDLGTMYTNSITATILDPAKLPVLMNNDKEAIVIALKTCNRVDPKNAKIIRIKNTLELDEVEVSVAYLEHVKNTEGFTLASEPYPFEFNENGNLFE